MVFLLFLSLAVLTSGASEVYSSGKNSSHESQNASSFPTRQETIIAIAKDSTKHIAESNKSSLDPPPQFTEGGTQNYQANNLREKEGKIKDFPNTIISKLSPPLDNYHGEVRSKIKGRKSAILNVTETVTEIPKINGSSMKTLPEIIVTSTPKQYNSTIVVPSKNTHIHLNKSTENIVKNETTLTTPIPKKPLILSGDDLEKSLIPKNIKVEKEDVGPRVSKVSSSISHPDLVIPVTITVFALPLFALLGYYALKHGREAWKNRHYRRMDFLLDGMYND